MINRESVTGHERDVGLFLFDLLESEGFRVSAQEVDEDRANLFATDRIYDGKPADWTYYMTDDKSTAEWKAKVLAIRQFLESGMKEHGKS